MMQLVVPVMLARGMPICLWSRDTDDPVAQTICIGFSTHPGPSFSLGAPYVDQARIRSRRSHDGSDCLRRPAL